MQQRGDGHGDERASSLVSQFEAANERLERRAGRNLPLAIIVGGVLGGVVLAALLVSPWCLVALVSAVTALAAMELAQALRVREVWLPRAGVAAAVVPIAPLGYLLGAWGLFAGVGLAAAVVAVWGLIEWRVRRRSIDTTWRARASLFAAAGIVFVIGWGLGTAGAIVADVDGWRWILVVIAVVVCNDTGAYATGVLIGKHPLAPRISPKKTIEGQVGAGISAVLSATLLFWLFLGLPWWWGALCGLVFMVSATVGDLSESAVKRWIGIKDMSSWLPGHGGLLDRLDAMIVSIPTGWGIMLLSTMLFH